MNNKVLRLKAVKDSTGLSRSSIYAMIKSCEFPSNISLGSRSVGWLESDIQKWINSRVNKSRQGV